MRGQRTIQWIVAAETPAQTRARRDVLCALDGLLALVEEHNVRRGAATYVPPSLHARLVHHGITCRTKITGLCAIDTIFLVQERYLHTMTPFTPDGEVAEEFLSMSTTQSDAPGPWARVHTLRG